MGAWDVGSFDNDDALDWVWELEEAPDTTILRDVLETIVQSEEYLEIPDCCAALVAAVNQRPASKLPAEVSGFISRITTPPPPELLQLAAEAVEKIKSKSELRELWDDSTSARRWLDEVDNLRARLTGANGES